MRGILFKKDDRWVVTEIIYELGDEIGTKLSIPVHPEHDEALLKSLDGEDVEFSIVNYHGTSKISEIWGGYAKVLGMYQQEPLLTDEEIAEFKADIKQAMKKKNGWISIKDAFPKPLQTVWISNGNGWTTLGCLVEDGDGWHWAKTNGFIYEQDGEIVSECESDDLDVHFWHELPKCVFGGVN